MNSDDVMVMMALSHYVTLFIDRIMIALCIMHASPSSFAVSRNGVQLFTPNISWRDMCSTHHATNQLFKFTYSTASCLPDLQKIQSHQGCETGFLSTESVRYSALHSSNSLTIPALNCSRASAASLIAATLVS